MGRLLHAPHDSRTLSIDPRPVSPPPFTDPTQPNPIHNPTQNKSHKHTNISDPP
jgi:hypothetical protein